MKYSKEMVNYLITAIILGQILAEEVPPKFCETTNFIAIFNYGLTLRAKKRISPAISWLWSFNPSTKAFEEPPVIENTVDNDMQLLTTFYIEDVPKCDKDPDYCQQIYKPNQMAFVRHHIHKTGKELTTILKVDPTNKMLDPVEPSNYPWNLTEGTKDSVWPKEWSSEADKPRPSAYSPLKGEVYYIIRALQPQNSALLWNNISTIDWFKHLNEDKLKSKTNFVGMFYLNSMVYAAGDNFQDQDLTTKLYSVTEEGDHRKLVPTNISLRDHFCKQPTISTNEYLSPNGETVTHSSTQTANESKSSGSLSPIVIIVCIIFAIILLVMVFGILYYSFKSKGAVVSTEMKVPKDDDTVVPKTSNVKEVESQKLLFKNSDTNSVRFDSKKENSKKELNDKPKGSPKVSNLRSKSIRSSL